MRSYLKKRILVLGGSSDIGKKLIKNILGNLNKNTFKNVWLSKLSCRSRDKLINSDRNFSPCDICDVTSTLIGKKHTNA